jgi:hypothetical protein
MPLQAWRIWARAVSRSMDASYQRGSLSANPKHGKFYHRNYLTADHANGTDEVPKFLE